MTAEVPCSITVFFSVNLNTRNAYISLNSQKIDTPVTQLLGHFCRKLCVSGSIL